MIRILFLFLFFVSLSVGAQNFSKVNAFIDQKQYKKAWEALKVMKGSDDLITVEKINLCLKYFAKAYHHEMFAFVDLKPNEDLLAVRRKAQNTMIPLEPYHIEHVLDSMLKRFPNSGALHKAKGDFYYDLFILYGKNHKYPKQELIRRMYMGYDKAEELGVKDDNSMYGLGYFWNLNDSIAKAKYYFSESVKLDSTNAAAHYNLAYLYLESGELEKALPHTLSAYRHYPYASYKADASRMAGMLYGRLGQHEKAVAILLESDKIEMGSYNTMNYLLNSFLALKKIPEAQLVAKNMFYMDWKNNTIHNDLIKAFLANNALDGLLDFYNLRLSEDAYDQEYRGHILLHMAQAYEIVGDEVQKKEYVAQAKSAFMICYDASHPIFQVLEKMVGGK